MLSLFASFVLCVSLGWELYFHLTVRVYILLCFIFGSQLVNSFLECYVLVYSGVSIILVALCVYILHMSLHFKGAYESRATRLRSTAGVYSQTIHKSNGVAPVFSNGLWNQGKNIGCPTAETTISHDILMVDISFTKMSIGHNEANCPSK